MALLFCVSQALSGRGIGSALVFIRLYCISADNSSCITDNSEAE